jgi:hypothetical protein
MIANIASDDALILPHRANPAGLNFRERQLHLAFERFHRCPRFHNALLLTPEAWRNGLRLLTGEHQSALPFNAACVVPIPRALRLRTFKREWPRGKPLHLCLMFNSTVRTSKPHQVGPDAGQGRVVNVKLKINRLSGLRAPSNETAHRVARNSQEKEGDFPRSLFAAWSISPRELNAGRTSCGPLERRLVVASRYP